LVTTIPELFYASLNFDRPDALAHREEGAWQPLSHRELQARVERLALALEAEGVLRGDRLGILSENRPEWAITDYACALSGIVTVPVYANLNLPQTAHILQNSRTRWVVCSTPEQLGKLLELWPGLPHLEVAVLMAGELPQGTGRPLKLFADLLERGAALEPRRPEVRERSRTIQPSDLLTLIYTSGTTGDPKGAMLSHGNVVSNALAGLKVLQPQPGDRLLSILPLSHIFERTGGHYIMLYCGVSIYYAESLQTVARDLQEVRPQVLLAVPRIYEKVYGKVREQVNARGFLKRLVFSWVTRIGSRIVPYLYEDRTPPLGLRLAGKVGDLLVFAKIRALFGGRLRLAATGGAAIHPRILDFFWAAGLPIFEGYGLTETSPILSLCGRGDMRPGYVGRPVMDLWEGKPFLILADDGEILCRGPNVMLGYWEDEAATREVMDAEGYFRTGDIGAMDAQGRLKITDRKKEIIVTPGGKNIAPQPMENALRADKYIEQAVVIGDRRNYITALLVPNFPELRRWAAHKKLPFTTDAELAALPEAAAKIMRRVERVNTQFSNYERVRRVALLERELTPDSGLLTPSLKIRRKAVAEAFADRIDRLYAE
jgi:long-chain acyl-CoA synthetase